MTYNYLITLKKGLKSFFVILLSLILAGIEIKYPQFWGLAIGGSTIGALLTMLLNYLKNRWGVKVL